MKAGYLIVSAMYILLVSCTKKGTTADGVEDRTAPSITIISPTNGQVFTAGQTVTVSATVTDNVKVSVTEIHLINETTEVLLRDIHTYPNASNATMQDSFVAEAGSTYTIKFIARDPSQNEARSQITIHVN